MIFRIVFLALLLLNCVHGQKRCGICACYGNDLMGVKLICNGIGLEELPPLGDRIYKTAVVLGMRRNSISLLTYEFISRFSRLRVLDMKGQEIDHECVYLDFDRRQTKVALYGEFTPNYPRLTCHLISPRHL